ncbi:MAG: Heme-binding protein [Verrucomicrobiales bacterium]|nr:Heme-binding protein [Verrucomicrobiales bacterium]
MFYPMRICVSSKFILRFWIFVGCLLASAECFGQAHGTNTDAELSVKKLEAAPGLKVELFASDPLLQNPVAFSIDEKGRFFISESHRYKDSIFDITQRPAWLTNDLATRTVPEREAFLRKTFGTNIAALTKDSEIIRLVEDRDGDGRAETSTIFADGFNDVTSGTAAGILARKGDVWFTCIPDLWKLKEEAGKVNSREKMSTGYGPRISVSGHDLHGLALGPDGRIYFSSGDRGFCVTNREGKVFAYPETGGVLRCNQDGSNLEVFCIGLRNPQELAFDQYGNLFTDDNDTAGPDDSRVLYLVEGADYGWRASYQYMDGYGPWCRENNWKGNIDDLLPYSGVVAHGPAGLAFYPGTGLPEKYKNHFLACDFPRGVESFAIKQKGASYEVYDVENFLKRLGATDVAFGPNSDVYVSDWGMAYTMPNAGRIYRVFDPAQTKSAAKAEVKKLLSEDMEKKSAEELKKLLSHPDMRVRLEAQFAISTNIAVQKAALASGNPLERIHAIWSLVNEELKHPNRVAPVATPSTEATNFVFSMVTAALKDADPEVRAQAAKAIGDVGFAHLAPEALLPLLQDTNARVRFFAAMSVGKLKNNDAIEALFTMLRDNADKDAFLVHAGVFALVNLGDEAVQKAAHDNFVAVRRAGLLAMRRMGKPEIAEFLNDPEQRLVIEAARAINDAAIPDALPQLAALLNTIEYTAPEYLTNLLANPQEQLARRSINANFRLGDTTNAEALATFARNEKNPHQLRIEALNAIADWENPDPRDRVVGLWRPLPGRNKEDAELPLRGAVSELFQSDSDEILRATIQVFRKFGMQDTTIIITDLFANTNRSTALRIESLTALVDLKCEVIEHMIKLGLVDQNLEVRREAIKYIQQMNPEDKDTARFLENLFTTEQDLRIRQTILITLGNIKDQIADQVIGRLMDQLIEKKIQPELQLDLIEAAGKHNDPKVKQRIESYKATLPKEDAMREYGVALVGGDADNGKRIFHEREDVGCLRCHSIRHVGGTVGPDLADIGKRQTREYLLESIVTPNKQISAGFENVVVLMKNGTSHAGLVKSETDTELAINSSEEGEIKVKKSEITKRNAGMSPMPEDISKLLTKREVRDVVEYLSTLK